MNDTEESAEKKFKVTDRRHFTEKGEPRPEDEVAPSDDSPFPGTSTLESEPSSRPGAGSRKQSRIDFSSFVLSLAGSAMMHMGEGPPGAPEQTENLEAAKQMIDILEMLQEKTEGNRSSEENQLMQQLLFELQMTFVKKRS